MQGKYPMNPIKQKIYTSLEKVRKELETEILNLNDVVDVTEYKSFVRYDGEIEIWSDAIQQALNEHEIINIPSKENPYYIDIPLIIPSNRHIEASPDAIIRQIPTSDVIMLRNQNAKDGTHLPINTDDKNYNISINGGRWEESHTSRLGYGKSNKYDAQRSYYGVSTCMFFSNVEGLSLTNIIFKNTAGFSVQVGDVKNSVMENIVFEKCFADGLHINGNCENLIIRNIEGEVGDDLVALNMYDWLDSSVNFGPMRNVLCENLDLYESSPYKAIRIQPGVYYYDDDSEVDCAIYDAIIKNVKGITTYKMYFQTPPYKIGTEPEKGAVGSADNLFFEDITIDLTEPIDKLPVYVNSDSLRGTMAGFEFGANIGHVYFENINITLYKDKWPMSYLACIGPKSALSNDGTVEIFDPYLSSCVDYVEMKNVYVNGEKVSTSEGVIKEIVFDDINNDGHSTARGKFKQIVIK